jgi:hypothetical protein
LEKVFQGREELASARLRHLWNRDLHPDFLN